jgi:hypothetical protein
LLPWCCLAAVGAYTLGKIVDPDKEARETKAAEKKEKAAEDAAVAGEKPSAGASTDSGTARTGRAPATTTTIAAGTTTEAPAAPNNIGPRWPLIGPISWALYGIELLIGTRRRRPKNTAAAANA